MVFLSIYHNIHLTLKNYDHEVIYRPSGRGIPYMVSTFDLAGEYVAVNVSDSFHGLLAEEYGGFYGLFVHLFSFWVHKDTSFRVLNQIYRI